MTICALDTSMLIHGHIYSIQMRRDGPGAYWKFDVESDDGEVWATDLNTRHEDFESASNVVEDYTRNLGEQQWNSSRSS